MSGILGFISSLIYFYEILICIWAIGSWFPIKQGSLIEDIYQAIRSLVEPFVNIFRAFIPSVGGLDFSPLVAMLALQMISRFLG